jgi:hypothetical protein
MKKKTHNQKKIHSETVTKLKKKKYKTRVSGKKQFKAIME